MTLILASASPRRKQLLEQLGYTPEVSAVDIDESPKRNEHPIPYVERMAETKLLSAIEQLKSSRKELSCVVLASDTTVIADNQILGKPLDIEDYLAMMSCLSGRRHQVATSFALAVLRSGLVERQKLETVVTDVVFKSLSNDEIRAYWNTGEPHDKAGGYGIQGAAAAFVERIEGSYSAVVGLPLMEVGRALESFGLPLFMERRTTSR